MQNSLHEQVFEFFEQFRSSHPYFYYWLRGVNNKDRLEEGYWFQGNDNYAFVGLYNRGGGSNRTRSFGLVFGGDDVNIGCKIEIVFNEENDKRILLFYQEAIKIIGGF